MSEVEDLGGRQVIRDPVSGRFTRVVLDPQTASEMSKASRSSTSSASRLLEEQGYNNTDNKAPEYISVMAKQAIKHTAAMAHWRRVHSLADQTSETGGMARPQQGEACQLCGQVNFAGADLSSLSDLLLDIRELDAANEPAAE